MSSDETQGGYFTLARNVHECSKMRQVFQIRAYSYLKQVNRIKWQLETNFNLVPYVCSSTEFENLNCRLSYRFVKMSGLLKRLKSSWGVHIGFWLYLTGGSAIYFLLENPVRRSQTVSRNAYLYILFATRDLQCIKLLPFYAKR